MNEEGDEDDGSDKYFLPEAIALPDLDKTPSGSECDEAPVQILQKHGRGRPLKAQIPDRQCHLGRVSFPARLTLYIHNLFSGSLPAILLVLGGS